MIFVAGYHASGKSYFASVLTEAFPALHVETSAVVREHWNQHGGNETDLQRWAAGMEATYGDNYFDDLIARTIEDRFRAAHAEGDRVKDVIVTGNRSLEGIQYLAEYFAGTDIGGDRNTIIAMHADFMTLWKRFCDRNRRPGDAGITESDFKKLTESETRRGIQDIFQCAEKHIHNKGNRDEFRDWAIEYASTELGMIPRDRIVDGYLLERSFGPEGNQAHSERMG